MEGDAPTKPGMVRPSASRSSVASRIAMACFSMALTSVVTSLVRSTGLGRKS